MEPIHAGRPEMLLSIESLLALLVILGSVNSWFSIENWTKMRTDETDIEIDSAMTKCLYCKSHSRSRLNYG